MTNDQGPMGRWSWVVRFAGVCLGVAGVVGCQPNARSATRPTTAAVMGEIPAGVVPVRRNGAGPTTASAAGGGAESAGADPAVLTPRLLGLDVYVISVPAGSVSRNEAFWKRVDESSAVSPGEYDLLYRNGIRVGVGQEEDWPAFKDLIDQNPATTQVLRYVSPGAKSVELDVHKEVATENVYYYGRGNRLSGRTYDDCVNLWTLSFQAVPRDPDLIRVSLTPMIRSKRKRLEVVQHRVREDEPPTREIAYVSPEYFFDLGVSASVPPGKFLVVAPSTEASPLTVGDAFLMGEGLGQRVEKVLLLVPRLVPATVEAAVKGR